MSVPMTLKDGTFVVRFFRQISITLAPAVWVIMTKFGRIAHWRGVFILGQLRPLSKGAGPQRSPILEFASIYAYTS